MFSLLLCGLIRICLETVDVGLSGSRDDLITTLGDVRGQ